jgi:hypothetical protein
MRRVIVEVPPSWLKPRKGDGDPLKKAKRRIRSLGTLGDADFRRVLVGRMPEAKRDVD